MRADLVGQIEQALHALAIEPVGERQRVVLELADHLRIDRAEQAGLRLGGVLRHEFLLGRRDVIEALAHLRESLAHQIDACGSSNARTEAAFEHRVRNARLRDRQADGKRLEITVSIDGADGKRVLDNKQNVNVGDWVMFGHNVKNDGHILAVTCR